MCEIPNLLIIKLGTSTNCLTKLRVINTIHSQEGKTKMAGLCVCEDVELILQGWLPQQAGTYLG